MSMNSIKALLLSVLSLLTFDVLATDQSDRLDFRARLSSYQEVPTLSTTGTGEFHVQLDQGETTLTYELDYSELEGTTTTAAHVHLGQRGVNGGVIFFICGGGGKPACPATDGTLTGTVTAADIIGPTGQGIEPGEFDEVIAAIRSGVTYVNVHTNKFPNGEIRGQINDRRHGNNGDRCDNGNNGNNGNDGDSCDDDDNGNNGNNGSNGDDGDNGKNDDNGQYGSK